MKKQKEPKSPLIVTVTPNPSPDYTSHARVEATLQLSEGKAIFGFAFADITDKELAETIGKALEERSLRNVKFDSETGGCLHVMWQGQAYPVTFWLRAEGPEYLYDRAKTALKKCVSKDL